jgi:hypothetical protein
VDPGPQIHLPCGLLTAGTCAHGVRLDVPLAAYALKSSAIKVSGFLTSEEIAHLTPSELARHRTPVPTQIVSSDEYYPAPHK